MKRFDDCLFKTLCWVIAALLFGMMTLIFAQVLARYIFHHSLSWSEEVGRFMFVWITFLGMAAAFKSGAHVALDLLPNWLKGVPQKTLRLTNCVLILVFAAAVFFSGLDLVELGLDQESPALNLPMDKIYWVFPISGGLLLYFGARFFWSVFTDEKEEKKC